jgi:hypothetical protein
MKKAHPIHRYPPPIISGPGSSTSPSTAHMAVQLSFVNAMLSASPFPTAAYCPISRSSLHTLGQSKRVISIDPGTQRPKIVAHSCIECGYEVMQSVN